MTKNRQEAAKIVSEMISPEVAELMENAESSDRFGAHIATLALENVFGALWSRPGLNRRDRSLVTLGILITLRATEELHVHIPAAIKNGLTQDELAEVLYHATAYAGFPAATSASTLAAKIFATA